MTVSEAANGVARPRRVLLTNPYMWPHVRRGAERLLHELSRDLLSAGCEVHVYAQAPAEGYENRGGVHHHMLRQRHAWPLRQLNDLHFFAWRMRQALRQVQPDAVFCLNYFDAWGALQARRLEGRRHPVSFYVAGIPSRRYFRAVPLDALFFRTVLRQADHIAVASRYARQAMQEEFGRDCELLPPPVAMPTGSPDAHVPVRGRPPSLLFVGDVTERRKGAAAACLALVELRRKWPGATLVLSGRIDDTTKARLLALPGVGELGEGAVQFAGLGAIEGLGAQYRRADVTLLPAAWEAFGMVLVESLAAGTPVVGTRHAGIPDIIDRPDTGALFEPGEIGPDGPGNIQGLVDAVDALLRLGKTPEVIAACQEHARRYSWPVLGPQYRQMILGCT